MRNLRGKVAFITGGSSGIGFGIAYACAAAGMDVAFTYRTSSHAEEARSKLSQLDASVLAIEADVGDRDALSRAARETERTLGRVNLICCNAGVGLRAGVCDASIDDWNYALKTNVLGVVNTIGAFLPRILNDGKPTHIAATSSMSGLFHAASAGVYTTTKFAVVGLMEALRSELRPHGIGVSVFCPGLVQSRIHMYDRQRPESAAGTTGNPQAAEQGSLQRLLECGMDPIECGQKFLRGIQRNDMYILTHPEFRPGLEDRFDAVLASFPTDADLIPEARIQAEGAVLHTDVYDAELRRLTRRRARSRTPSGET